jgi:predicted acylesterase/phospholipase RssA
MKQITHIVFAGNALRSLCICGILRYIYCYKMDVNIRDVAGTSMGAFFSLAYALKIPIERLEKMLYNIMKTDITKVYPNNFINLINEYGLNNSRDYLNEFRVYIKEIYNQDDITFLDLTKKTGINLYISVTEVNTGSNIIFNVDEHPNVSVLDAISASMCLPILSKPVKINDKYYIDGYLTNNFPIEVFSHINSEFILGVGVNTRKECILNMKEMTFINYFYNLFHMVYKNTDTLCYYNKLKNHKNILFITDSPVKSILNPNITDDYIDFSIDEELLNNLFLQGFKEMNDYSNNNLDLALDDKSSNFQDI